MENIAPIEGGIFMCPNKAIVDYSGHPLKDIIVLKIHRSELILIMRKSVNNISTEALFSQLSLRPIPITILYIILTSIESLRFEIFFKEILLLPDYSVIP